ncbi:unnamed protein product, partial [Mesorhabditis spiculigera]
MNPLTPNTIFFVDGSGLKNCAHQAVTAILDGDLKEAIEKLLAFDAPLALISYSSSQLLIARDAYGRESLLHSNRPDEENVQESLEWRDVPPGSVSPDIGSLQEMGSKITEFLLHGTNQLRQLLEAEIKCRETIAIAFSGGVDSLLMGHLLAIILAEGHEVDLINVAFGETPKECSQAPDRQRGLAGIVRPCDTVLDESLGFVMWFALRGIGLVDEETTVSTARKFVVGSGADELCAGYSRHKHRLEKEGAPGLQDELEMELVRYGWRNGSRDARVALYHGRRLV